MTKISFVPLLFMVFRLIYSYPIENAENFLSLNNAFESIFSSLNDKDEKKERLKAKIVEKIMYIVANYINQTVYFDLFECIIYISSNDTPPIENYILRYSGKNDGQLGDEYQCWFNGLDYYFCCDCYYFANNR